MTVRLPLTIALVLLFTPVMRSATAEQGVSPTAVRIGMVIGLTGSDAKVKQRSAGSLAYFQAVNARGGISGRKLEIVQHDDKYDPKLTVEYTKKLLENEGVLALFGYSGTAAVSSVLPLIEKADIPLVGPFSGADFLRTPFNRNLFPNRAALKGESGVMVNYLVNTLKIKEIGLLIQDDAFGAGARGAVVQALEKHGGLRLVGVGKYLRENLDVSAAVKDLTAAKPKAVILFSNEKPSIEFIRRWRAGTPGDIVFVVSSSNDPVKLMNELKKDAEGLIFTDGLPNTSDTSIAAIRSYQQDVKGEPSQGSLEGYLSARVLVEGLNRAGKELTRDSLRKALESFGDFNLEGLHYTYSSQTHLGLDKIYLNRIEGGKLAPLAL